MATNHVDLPKSYKFAPASVTVRSGTTVTWTNSDNFTHSVRLIDQADKIVGIMQPGKSVQFTFDTPGAYRYDCSFHPRDMHGTVLVTG